MENTLGESATLEWTAEDVDLLASWINETDETTSDMNTMDKNLPAHPHASSTHTTTTTGTSKDRNPTRQRRRDEMVYLRERVGELEGELAQLRAPLAAPTTNSIDTITCESTSEWEAIAQRQQKARERAELENYKLRSMLESQLKLAHTLERLLRKRDHAQAIDALPHKRLRALDSSCAEPETDAVVFERLLSKIGRSFAQTDSVLGANGLLDAPRGHRLVRVKQQQQETTVGGTHASSELYVEVTDVSSLPFPLHATASASWRCITAGYMTLDHEIYHELAGQNDVLAIKYAIALRRKRLVVDFNARAVIKRFVQDNQIVDVWEAISDTEGGHTSRRGAPGVQVRERGWTVFRQAPASDGGPDKTLVLSCMQMIPLISYSSSTTCSEEDRQVGLLTNLALDYYGDQLDLAQHAMESLLLDESRNATTLAELLPATSS